MKFIINTAKLIKETAKEIDGNDFLVAYDVPIAKTGIQQYSREELGDRGGNPEELVNVFRDPSTFKNKEIVESFDGIPVVYGHPEDGKIDNDNFKNFIVGTVSSVYPKDGDLYAKKLTIIDKQAIYDVLSKNMNELSIGFRGEISKEKGVYKGTPYEFRESVIHANHLALCEKGKAGSYYAINSQKKGATMEQKKEHYLKNNDGPDIPITKNIEGIVKQVVKEQLARVKPYLHDAKEEDEMDYMDSKETEEELEKEVDKEEKEDHVNKTAENLKETEHKDKDVIQALKNSVTKFKSLINVKNKEINELEIKNALLDEALIEARDIIKDMAGKINSSSLVNAMTGPDMEMPFNTGVTRDFNNSISKSLLLK